MFRPPQDQSNSTISKKIGDRSEFLFHAGHLIFAACPQLSRFYLSEFQASLRNQGTSPSKAIARQLCPHCGQLYVAGLNTTVTLETKRTSRDKNNKPSNKKRRRNVLVYECLACHYKARMPGSEPTIPKAVVTTTGETVRPSDAVATTATTATIATATTVPVKSLGSKSPSTSASKSAPSSPLSGSNKKKKKKNNLQAMLASRKSGQGDGSSTNSLGLGDFLSSL
ncbi:hypothetical protein BX666DRAFT_1873712 [Dichotomocladium elegans]|nr:hypothetical protein BX666DRAFT_1873712 [Dichotomocladium elegans]